MKQSPLPHATPGYAGTAIFLHWLAALLVGGTFALGLLMTDIPGLTPTKLKYFSWHKWIGLTVLLTMLPRLLWRLLRAVPAMPASMGRWQRRAAHLAHLALYCLLLAVPLSGLLYSQAAGVPVVLFGVLDIPALIAPDPGLEGGAEKRALAAELHIAGAGVPACAGRAQAPVCRPRPLARPACCRFSGPSNKWIQNFFQEKPA